MSVVIFSQASEGRHKLAAHMRRLGFPALTMRGADELWGAADDLRARLSPVGTLLACLSPRSWRGGLLIVSWLLGLRMGHCALGLGVATPGLQRC